MPKLNFTVRALEALKPPQSGRIEYWDESTNGSFGLRLSSTGKRSWVTMYRAGGRLRRFTVGDYERLPLSDARAIAKDILYRAAKGIDPAAEKSMAREAETFGQIADQYIQGWAIGPGGESNPRKRSWKQDQKLIEWYVLPKWKNLKAAEIKRADVKALLRAQVQRGAPVVANRLLSLVRKLFNYALEEELGGLEFNPCQAIKPPTKEHASDRVLSFEEIRKFWAALQRSEHREAVAILKLRLLTIQRGVELRLMEWSELDLESGWWTIPGARTKNKLAHRVPITEQIWKVLEPFYSARGCSNYVFASPRLEGRAILNLKDPFKEIFSESGISEPFVMRDLRRTGTTMMTGRLQIPRATVGKILNHVEPGVTKVYDRHSYDNEKRTTLTAWNALLERILTGDDLSSSTVINLRSKTRYVDQVSNS